MQVKKLIPCNCSACKNTQNPHFYPFDVLQKAKNSKLPKIQCQISFDMVDVSGLIDDIENVARDKEFKPINVSRNKIFISYSHQDREYFDQLQKHLKPMICNQTIEVWDDTKIRTGDEWRKEIEIAITEAKVAVLLVSPDFLASDFIAKEELPSLLQASKKEGLTVFWIPIRPSGYEFTKIKDYQAAHEPKNPLSKLNEAEQDEAWVNICKKLQKAFES